MDLKNKFLGQLLLEREINDGLFIWRWEMELTGRYIYIYRILADVWDNGESFETMWSYRYSDKSRWDCVKIIPVPIYLN